MKTVIRLPYPWMKTSGLSSVNKKKQEIRQRRV